MLIPRDQTAFEAKILALASALSCWPLPRPWLRNSCPRL